MATFGARRTAMSGGTTQPTNRLVLNVLGPCPKRWADDDDFTIFVQGSAFQGPVKFYRSHWSSEDRAYDGYIYRSEDMHVTKDDFPLHYVYNLAGLNITQRKNLSFEEAEARDFQVFDGSCFVGFRPHLTKAEERARIEQRRAAEVLLLTAQLQEARAAARKQESVVAERDRKREELHRQAFARVQGLLKESKECEARLRKECEEQEEQLGEVSRREAALVAARAAEVAALREAHRVEATAVREALETEAATRKKAHTEALERALADASSRESTANLRYEEVLLLTVELQAARAAETRRLVERPTAREQDARRINDAEGSAPRAAEEEETASLRGSCTDLAEPRHESMKVQRVSAWSFVSQLQEFEVPAAAGRPAERHVKVACPGIEPGSICADSITNGVIVKIREGTNEHDVVAWERTFVYRGFELSHWFLHCGILNLILKRVLLERIDEEMAARRPVAPRLSPTPSELPSENSSWVSPDRELDAMSVAGGSDRQSATSAPAAASPIQCLKQTARVLCEGGRTVPVAQLKPGMKLRALLPGGVDARLGYTEVQEVRTSMRQEIDFVECTLDHTSECVLQVTANHHMLARNGELGWIDVLASDVREKCDLLIVSKDEPEAMHSVRSVRTVRKYVESEQVVEVVLRATTDALFVQLSDGDFVAVFGSPGWLTNYKVHTRHTFLDVEAIHRVGEATSSKSDPIHDRQQVPGLLYRRILPPHDAQCKEWCKFHFNGVCKKSIGCTNCHDEEHRQEASRQRTHRGSRPH